MKDIGTQKIDYGDSLFIRDETHRTRLTVGGNLINFPGDFTTLTEDFITTKLIFNSVLSTNNGKFMCADIVNFYLNNPMNIYEYMKVPLDIII